MNVLTFNVMEPRFTSCQLAIFFSFYWDRWLQRRFKMGQRVLITVHASVRRLMLLGSTCVAFIHHREINWYVKKTWTLRWMEAESVQLWCCSLESCMFWSDLLKLCNTWLWATVTKHCEMVSFLGRNNIKNKVVKYVKSICKVSL